jgi:hypothetical protein
MRTPSFEGSVRQLLPGWQALLDPLQKNPEAQVNACSLDTILVVAALVSARADFGREPQSTADAVIPEASVGVERKTAGYCPKSLEFFIG